MERGCSEKVVRAQIFKEKGKSRDSLLKCLITKTSKAKFLISLIIKPFRISEAYCKNFKFFNHHIKRFFLRL